MIGESWRTSPKDSVSSGQEFLMVRAVPEKYELLSRAKLGVASVSSSSVADGRLFVRLNKTVACFEFRKP